MVPSSRSNWSRKDAKAALKSTANGNDTLSNLRDFAMPREHEAADALRRCAGEWLGCRRASLTYCSLLAYGRVANGVGLVHVHTFAVPMLRIV